MCVWGASKDSCSFFGVGEVKVNYCGMVISCLIVVCSVCDVYGVLYETGCSETVVNSSSEFSVFCSVGECLFVRVPVSISVD